MTHKPPNGVQCKEAAIKTVVVESRSDVDQGTLVISAHPSGSERVKEAIKSGLLLKGTPQIVEGLLLPDSLGIKGP